MTALILLTYGQLGQQLLDAATHIMKSPMEKIQLISVHDEPDTADKLPLQLEQAIGQTGADNQCLILVDLQGCTHFNIARKFVQTSRLALVSGLNLAMLLRVLNHQDEDLFTLSQYAEEGGVMGISVTSDEAAEDSAEISKA